MLQEVLTSWNGKISGAPMKFLIFFVWPLFTLCLFPASQVLCKAYTLYFFLIGQQNNVQSLCSYHSNSWLAGVECCSLSFLYKENNTNSYERVVHQLCLLRFNIHYDGFTNVHHLHWSSGISVGNCLFLELYSCAINNLPNTPFSVWLGSPCHIWQTQPWPCISLLCPVTDG